MFSRTTKDLAAAEPTAGRKVAVASLVAEGVRIRGDLATADDLHLDGALEGDLQVGRLVIGETGCVTGAVQAESVDVRGRLKGSICARQVRLWATAHVEGDISHGELSVESGAHFEGRSLVLAPPTAVAVEPLSVAAE